VIDDGLDPQAAIDAPRWRVEPWDWRVRVEADHAPEVVAALEARGHQLVEVGARDVGMGHAHAIAIRPRGYAVATDPRAEGAAVGL
jgi:gamma-glutamyltranspeptidase/glutathione hydrolase